MKNPMHMDSGKNPFTGGGGKSLAPKYAKMSGALTSNPGGKGDKVSANAAMKHKPGK